MSKPKLCIDNNNNNIDLLKIRNMEKKYTNDKKN